AAAAQGSASGLPAGRRQRVRRIQSHKGARDHVMPTQPMGIAKDPGKAQPQRAQRYQERPSATPAGGGVGGAVGAGDAQSAPAQADRGAAAMGAQQQI